MMMWGFGWTMMLFMMLFWVAIIGLAVWFLSALFPRSSAHNGTVQTRETGTDTALEILRQRYARGELTRDEYEQMRRDLEA
jgi:putative membrane protein